MSEQSRTVSGVWVVYNRLEVLTATLQLLKHRICFLDHVPNSVRERRHLTRFLHGVTLWSQSSITESFPTSIASRISQWTHSKIFWDLDTSHVGGQKLPVLYVAAVTHKEGRLHHGVISLSVSSENGST